jgi:group I intron endonuclease
MKRFIVYEIKNNLNGKIYIGQYSGSNFDSYFGSGKLIKAAIQKYGLENFTKSVLEECTNKEELNSREVYRIKERSAIENGYNLTEGGTGGDTSSFINYTDLKYLEKKSKITKQYWDSLSVEEREERSIKVRGQYNGMFGKEGYWKGKQKPPELIEKSMINRRSYNGASNPNWKGGISNSTCEVCDKKISQSATRCMEHIKYERNGINNPFYGKTHSDEIKAKLRDIANARTTKPSNSKKVIADGVLYQTGQEAAKTFGITRGLVNYRCKSNKYNWMFVD